MRAADRTATGARARRVQTTITYLTLHAPPEPPPAKPSGFDLKLLRAEKIPLGYYRYLYGAVGANWLWFERLLLDDRELARRIHAPGVEVTVLYADGAPAGYFEIEFNRTERAGLAYFGLTPDWSGRKIGPWFLGQAIREGLSRGAQALTVNTCTLDHPAALPLYQRLGFRLIRRETREFLVPDSVTIPDHIAFQA